MGRSPVSLRQQQLPNLSHRRRSRRAELVNDNRSGSPGQFQGLAEVGAGGEGGREVRGDSVPGPDDVDLAAHGVSGQVFGLALRGRGEQAAFGERHKHRPVIGPREGGGAARS